MSGSYQPSPDAAAIEPWNTAFLAQRDASFEIPYNFQTYPGVSLRHACFGNDRYEDAAARLCISNLLSMGFKRLIVDLYWDSGRGMWSLCPAAYPESASEDDSSTSTSTTSLGLRPSLPSDALEAAAAVPTGLPEAHAVRRQEDQGSAANIPGTTDSATATDQQAPPAYTTMPYPEDGGLLQIGPFTCSATVGFSLVTDVLFGYFVHTDTLIDVDLTIVELNIHAAASRSSPDLPAGAPEDTQLPSGEQQLGNILGLKLPSRIYTPKKLHADRSNLNESVFEVLGPDAPIIPYYTIEMNDKNIYTTPDGWPTETFSNFEDYARTLVSFGYVDPQMSRYNFSADGDTIFSASQVSSPRNITVSSSGAVTSGCFFDSNNRAIKPATNNSWAITTRIPIAENASFTTESTNSLRSISACGISSILNQTLSGRTADTDPQDYISFVNAATVWSWAPGEPRNSSLGSLDASSEGGNLRCAAFFPSSSGQWRAVDCGDSYHAACRIADQPYLWTISDDRNVFQKLDGSCPDNSSFAVPRTGLENSYFLASVQEAYTRMDKDDRAEPIFVNLQSLDRDGCWVTGTDQTCPYLIDPEVEHSRTVIIPAVGAVIIFVIAAIMLFIKCASNRRKARRGRRRGGGDRGDYEGVPS